jgi:SAV_6107-like HEPN
MNFDVYLKNGWIKPHATSRDEIARLLAIADRDIRQSKVAGLEPEWRFDIAYNAALQLATAALAASGFEAERQNKHQRTIECLSFSLKELTAKDAIFFDKSRQKRHVSVYDMVGAISAQEATEMVDFAGRLRRLVLKWLKAEHPALLP